MTDTWEYRQVVLKYDLLSSLQPDTKEKLNSIGGTGFELVSVNHVRGTGGSEAERKSDYFLYTFKRRSGTTKSYWEEIDEKKRDETWKLYEETMTELEEKRKDRSE